MPVILLYIIFGVTLSSAALTGHPLAGLIVWITGVAIVLHLHATHQQRKRPTQ